jgi:phage terminase large subunit-like protein
LHECDADIVFFGGAAGSGKSTSLLMEAARQEFIAHAGYRGIIFRRTTRQVTNPGGLWDSSKELYYLLGAEPRENTLDWTFSTGSKIQFAHLEHSKNIYNYQGAQVDFLGFDELTHFSEAMFLYLLSRNRSPSGLRCRVLCTMNPDGDSWVADWVDWYIDPETGLPLTNRSGILRYFVRMEEITYWADTKDELRDRFDPDIQILSFTVIFALIYDNPIFLAKNPQYLANLNALHPVERSRLLLGNWKVKFSVGKVFQRQWFNIIPVEACPPNGVTCRHWDIAATAAKLATASHYFTAGTKIRRNGDRYTILHSLWEQVGPSEVESLIIKTAQADGKQCKVRFELEGGSNAIIFADGLRRKLRSLGFNADYVAPRGDKVARAMPLATAAYNNQVDMVEGLWNEVYLDCCLRFDGSAKPLINDVIDSSSGCYSVLSAQSAPEPNIQPPQRDLQSRRVF